MRKPFLRDELMPPVGVSCHEFGFQAMMQTASVAPLLSCFLSQNDTAERPHQIPH